MKKTTIAILLMVFTFCTLKAQNDDVYYSPGSKTDSSQIISLGYNYYSSMQGKEINYIQKTEACLDIRYRQKTVSRMHEGATMMYLTTSDIVDKENPKYLVGIISAFRNDTVYLIHADGESYKDFPVALSDLSLVGFSSNPKDFVIKEGEKPYVKVRKINLNKPFYSVEIRSIHDRKYEQTVQEFISPIVLQILVDILVVGLYGLTYW